jgi:lysophospholipase L1-like esterase
MNVAKGLLLLLPMLLLLGLGELVVRIASEATEPPPDSPLVVQSEDPELIFEYRPSAVVQRHDVEYRTNAAGFRDRELAPKRAETFRILVVGDSVVFGYGEPVLAAFPQQLDALLRERRGPPIEVFNLGIAGYNSLQQVRLVEARALAHEPDLLVLPYVHNDNKEDGGDGGLSRYFKRSPSRLYDWLRIRLRRLSRRIGRDVTTEAYDRLAEITQERALPVVVVVFPAFRFRDGAWSRPERHRAVRALAQERGFAVLDLLDAFVEADFESLMRDNIHPNPRGYALAARELRDFLSEEGLLPAASGAD